MSTNPTQPRRLRALVSAAAGIGMLGASFAALPAAAAPSAEKPDAAQHELLQQLQGVKKYEDGRYFVILKEQPAATYDGGVEGIPATSVTSSGGEFRADSPAVQKYDNYLTAQQTAVASTADVTVKHHFTTAINGFVAQLTADQALALAQDDRVLAVSEDEELTPDYSSTEFLGLTPETGDTWNKTYGGIEQAGKGVVVGVIDTGIHPDNPFVAGEPVKPLSGAPQVGVPYLESSGRIAMLKADGTTYRGECEVGEDFTADDCNDKLVGARYFADDFLAYVPPNERHENERISPLDIGSHGTHTATTAAGNHDVEQTIAGASYGKGSGVAPAAKIAAYKVCWEDTDPDTGGCYSSSSVGAIEAGITDNVDVLNYSISGNNNSVVDPVALAFKSAAEAGIFVSASAGNSGPTPDTVAHSSPWLTSVAASTFSNDLMGTVEFADGKKVRGVSSMANGVGPADVVLAEEVGATGKTADQVRLCYPGALDADKAEGKIVVCDRGGNARAEKSVTVKDAGGVGMVLVNIGGGSEDADLHAVPTVHTSDESVKTHVRNTDVQATLVQGDTSGQPEIPQPQIAGFSSRGPSNAVNLELLKPDVAAPGVNVIAGVSPLDPGYGGDSFGLMSGTSMAAPNLAGMAALMAGKNPDWSPMAIKSAMMTTAEDVKNADGSNNLDNFATGAGSADPAKMAQPGLVYESDSRQWDALLLGTMRGRDVNVPSIAVSDLVNTATVKRTVTATQAGTWAADADVPGFDVSVSPATVSLAKGESAEVTITFSRTTAKHNEWNHGSLTWIKPAGQSVTSPVTLRALDLSATSSVEGEGAQGSETVELQGGMTGAVDPTIDGLAKATSVTFTKVPGGLFGGSNPSNDLQQIAVGEGVESLVLKLNAHDEVADWDMVVITPAGRQINVATAAGSEELVIPNPAAGRYLVVSNLYSSQGNGEATATLEHVQLAGDAGNLTVNPDPVNITQGETTEAELVWSGLTEGVWKGVVTWAPGVTTAVSVTVGAGTGEPAECTLEDFTDNAPGSQYYADVRWMQCADITRGYSDGTYRKGKDISRAESVAFLYRHSEDEFTAPAVSPFTDVSTGHTHYTPITWAADQGITTGYADKTFRAAQSVTRGEFAAFVYRYAGAEFTATDEAPFSDVAPGSTHHEAISWMKSVELTNGRADGTFGVSDPITRGEVAAFLHRLDQSLGE